eukprot:c30497_g1_i1 orf=14-196(-)
MGNTLDHLRFFLSTAFPSNFHLVRCIRLEADFELTTVSPLNIIKVDPYTKHARNKSLLIH